ncbi:hypothetical protein [Peredibacter starrii]|uniref:Uncharacterized protein n=1 Tax=Peredibacter starrii TaxID=28202 RepID=A0AAX4HTT9_9BACT|nr:hypothetical protein [Peredibacter starrii]WPU66808.1 hypothetical protein SOO65_08610 [Peredibacter starrii]
MSRALNLYFRLSVKELERVIEDYQVEFDQALEDTFSDDELLKYETMIDSIAALYVQPISNELSFDDFYAYPSQEEKQRLFFESCRSSLVLENLPYFESNPIQVTYLTDLLWSFEEVLIDPGGVSNLMFRKDYLEELKRYKTMDSLLTDKVEKVVETKSSVPVTPIDFLVLDVYKELDRLKGFTIPENDLGEKPRRIFEAMKNERLDSTSLFRKSGLIPKDFDDGLERLKFFLRKLQ